VTIAESNPNPETVMDALYPTRYKVEVFYLCYVSASTRPSPQGVPSTLSYITIPSNSYTGAANKAADATTVTSLCSGFTTHAVNMEYIAFPLNSTSNPEEFLRNFQVNFKDLSANLATFTYIFLLNYLGTLTAM